jgi:hypothetical protein
MKLIHKISILIIGILFFGCFETHAQTTYYMDATNGSDSNSGISTSQPWKTLSKISSVVLKPGDMVLFKKGERFDGYFVVKGSGSATQPITISSYGSGNKPIITAEVGAAGGGDYREAIYVNNNDNFVFEGLEVNNERKVSRSGVDDKESYGIHIHNSGNQIMKNFTFRNMTFQNVYAVQPMLEPDDFNGLEVAGLRIASDKNTVVGQEKNIQDVLMENCYFTDLQRLGVHIKHAGGNSGSDDINRNKNLVFRNNEFHYIGGTCILPSRTYNCLIEDNIFNHPGDNSDPRMPNRGSSVWTWRCINTVIQNNQCLHIRGYLDSHGIHIDHENKNTFVQYNYMEDCEGGFVEILGGNVNAVYRFNVSVNDGWRNNPNWINSNHTIWINEKVPSGVHYSDENYIYNNTVVMNYGYSTAIDIDATNTHIYNNIFYAINGANLGGQQVVVKNNNTPFYMRNNLYYGTIKSSFKNLDTNPVNGNPNFNNEGSGDKYGYQLNVGSNAINTGVAKQGPPIPEAGTGIFKHIPAYPNVDFYGNPIDLSTGTPNIGVCNSKNGEIKLSVTEAILKQKKNKIYPNPVTNILNISNLNEETLVKVYNTQGQILIQKSVKNNIDVSALQNGVYFLRIEGQKTLKFIKINQ